MGQAYHQPNAEGFRKQFAAIRSAASDGSGGSPDAWLAEYDAGSVELT